MGFPRGTFLADFGILIVRTVVFGGLYCGTLVTLVMATSICQHGASRANDLIYTWAAQPIQIWKDAAFLSCRLNGPYMSPYPI